MKAAKVAKAAVGADAFSAAWLVHQHGYRWDTDGHWTRLQCQVPTDPRARLYRGDVLWVDEAGTLDQDTALALLTIADEARARVVLAGDRHQLPAVGRGGVLDHAARWADPLAVMSLDTIHRFSDPDYANLSLQMRTGESAGEVFDALVARGDIKIYPTYIQQHIALTALGAAGATDSPGGAQGEVRVIAQTRELVARLNADIRDRRLTTTDHTVTTAGHNLAGGTAGETVKHPGEHTPGHTRWLTTTAGDRIGVGDRVATRRNDPDLNVANRDTWTVTSLDPQGGLRVTGRLGTRHLSSDYVAEFVELAYATTVHGAQGETVDHAHFLVGESTGAAAAYVAMTRGRHNNTAHMVADTVDDARAQWVEVFSRDRADLGPRHAARAAVADIDAYGPEVPVYVSPVRRHEDHSTYHSPYGSERDRGYGPSR